MIRHTPLGSGHPYAVDTDQRSPVLPVAGEELRIGARASADVTEVIVGVEDRIIPARHADGLPGAIRVVRIEGAGHIPHMEKSADVNTAIQDTIARAEA